MCGIVGIASNTPLSLCAWLSIGRDAMIHRGPDDAGEWWSEDKRIGFAHRRLSIIDLSPSGHQPMVDAEYGLVIVFNGEIYNFRELRMELASRGAVFSSYTDTEVILAAYREWGTECLARLNGMFAFALYDMRQRVVFLARDRAGEKPLFYYYHNRTLRFASELKALMADDSLMRRINPQALDCYLALGYVPGELCILENFNKLPPGHALQFDLQTGDFCVWSYWQLPELDPETAQKQVDDASLIDELEMLLEDAVRRQLVADVPVGVLLSGGVDSSLLTAMAVRATSKVKTFTIRMPGHSKLDETEHARLIARHFGTEHVELEALPTTADLLPRLAYQFDEPMADSSMIPTFLVSQLVRQHCTVALGGDGGDELFGGYSKYNHLLWLQERLQLIPRPLLKSISFCAEHILPVGFKGRSWLQSLGTDLQQRLPIMTSYFDVTSRRKLMAIHQDWPLVAELVLAARLPKMPDILQRTTRLDFSNYLAEDILVKVDRASMLTSLEMRAPLLDYRLIEFAFGRVPIHLKATLKEKKILPKFLATRLLPKEFDRQRKQGFSIPLAQWLKSGSWRELFQDVLYGSDTIFNQRMIRALWKGQERGRSNGDRLFNLVLFELWRRQYKITI